ncbi:MAG: thioredoxin family protein [Verrucomicrobia bacterium]|nr:thioredoxin family protein [Verrucomicrobiota bacterium]
MKRILVGFFTCLALSLVQARSEDSEWLADVPTALAKAKESKKLVLLDFTGSDWCPPCKALHSKVFTSSAFKEYAKEKLVLVEVDFPNSKPQTPALKSKNAALAKKFQIDSYPTVILLDSEGKELGRVGGYGGQDAKAYIAKLDALKKK